MLKHEMKKIFKLKTIIPALLIFLFLCCIFPGSVVDCYYDSKKMDTQNYPEQIPLDLSKYSVEKKFNDMLLLKYGLSIDNNEIQSVKSELEMFANEIENAVKKDEILLRNNIVFGSDYSLYSMDADASDISEKDRQYIYECVNGVRQLEGTKYPLYYAQGFASIITYVEQNNTEYKIMSNDVIQYVSNTLIVIVFSVVSSLIILVPYGIDENRSDIIIFEKTTYMRNKILAYKTLSIIMSSLLIILIGVIVSILILIFGNITEYFDCNIETILHLKSGLEFSEFTEKCYSDISVIKIYGLLTLLISIFGICTCVICTFIAFNINNIVLSVLLFIPAFTLLLITYLRYISEALYKSLPVKTECFIVFGSILLITPCIVFICDKIKNTRII